MASEDLSRIQRAAAQQMAAFAAGRGVASASSDQMLVDGRASGVLGEVAGEQYLTFSLLDREFALKAEQIQSVERLVDVTPVPHVAPWMRGVINLRGSIASVVDLRMFLDMEQLPYNPRTRLLSVQCNDMLPIPETAITSVTTRQTTIPHWAAPYAAGTAWLGKRAIVLLDAARLLFSEKMQHYEVQE